MLKKLLKKNIKKLLNLKSEYVWYKNINKIYKEIGAKNANVSKELIREHQKYWSQLKKNVNPMWFLVYSSITNNPDIHFVPENIYFSTIEKKLNNRRLAIAFGDKNFYEKLYTDKEIFPETIIRNIDGVFYGRDYKLLEMSEKTLNLYLNNYEKIILKPSVISGGGKNIQLFWRESEKFKDSNGRVLSYNSLRKMYNHNFVIQNYLKQSRYLSQFNDTSVNTVRLFTYRSVKNDEVTALHMILRIGKKGNYIDDQNTGGVACMINEDGRLNNFATDILGRKYYDFNGIKFSQTTCFPQINEIKKLAVSLAYQNIHSRVIGFDFTLDENNNIRLIEINHLWTGINFFQMNSSSVFGKYTDEIIEFCKHN